MTESYYNEKFMRRAMELAVEAVGRDEVPVGAVIVRDGEIISEGTNRKERSLCAVRHAEIEAIERASEKLGNWWLEGCEMYVTLEPCPMCAGAIINARLDKLYFGAYDLKTGACGSRLNVLEKGLLNHDVEVEGGLLERECGAMLSEFFKRKRGAKG